MPDSGSEMAAKKVNFRIFWTLFRHVAVCTYICPNGGRKRFNTSHFFRRLTKQNIIKHKINFWNSDLWDTKIWGPEEFWSFWPTEEIWDFQKSPDFWNFLVRSLADLVNFDQVQDLDSQYVPQVTSFGPDLSTYQIWDFFQSPDFGKWSKCGQFLINFLREENYTLEDQIFDPLCPKITQKWVILGIFKIKFCMCYSTFQFYDFPHLF